MYSWSVLQEVRAASDEIRETQQAAVVDRQLSSLYRKFAICSPQLLMALAFRGLGGWSSSFRKVFLLCPLVVCTRGFVLRTQVLLIQLWRGGSAAASCLLRDPTEWEKAYACCFRWCPSNVQRISMSCRPAATSRFPGTYSLLGGLLFTT